MNMPLRADSFYSENLKPMYGPVQILKRTDSGLSTLLPKLYINLDDGVIVDQININHNDINRWTAHGDIGYADGKGNLRVVLSDLANANTLLVTEQCDNLCLFCSQPPRNINDEILFSYAAQSIVAFNSKKMVGVSGGEPLLKKEHILNFFRILNQFNNETPLHILTNGRSFQCKNFTNDFYELQKNRRVIMGIPLYGTNSDVHDKLVNTNGAWAETIKGLINAGNKGIEIELRIIPTQLNYKDISSIIEMALTCFNHITRISIMNLEQMGWAKKNWNELYIDPPKYHDELIHSCRMGNKFGVDISLFNYPLCHIPFEIHHYARKSISDWKNSYMKECDGCSLKQDCGGFFTSIKHKWINPQKRII
jgi:His-Xaa-Ser system radical SAM maturase HxsC